MHAIASYGGAGIRFIRLIRRPGNGEDWAFLGHLLTKSISESRQNPAKIA